MTRTLVIAEPGCTGEGHFDAMLHLLEVARASGADVWKPQWVSSAARHLERRSARLNPDEKAAFYQKYERPYSWLQWPAEWHQTFQSRCHELGMQYACSVCLPEDVAIVAPFVDYLKISSFEAQDVDLVREALLAMYGNDRDDSGVYVANVIVSTGMSNEITDWRIWEDGRCREPRFVLHCVSAYPAPLDQMNLGVISGNGRHFGESSFSGLSDHSRNLVTGAVAVGAGATVIEAHYRLTECDLDNPDYVVSFTPEEFTEYIANIRQAELMMGNGIKQIQPCEREMARYQVSG